jgi:excisionase family DNA binding protein
VSHPSVRCPSCGAHIAGDEPVLGPGRVAKLFGVSRRTVSDWVRAGKLPSINPGGVARIPAHAVEQLLAQGGASR